MTTNGHAPELAPAIEVQPVLRTAAGLAASVSATVTNRAAEPRILAVTLLGVDPNWLPRPSRSDPVPPGQSVPLSFTVRPAIGALPARYPITVTVQAIDPESGRATSNAVLADLTVVVDAPGQIEVGVDPADVTMRIRKRVTVQLHNTGSADETVYLEVKAPDIADVRLPAETVDIAAGEAVALRGSLAVKPRVFGHRYRFTYTVSARGSGVARRVEAAVTSRSFLGPSSAKVFALLAVATLWAALALIFIPKLSANIKQGQEKGANAAASAQARAEASAAGQLGPSGGSGNGSGSNGGGGSGGGGSGGAGSGGGGGSGGAGGGGGASGGGTASANTLQLSGTVGGSAPGGVGVAMQPTSLVDSQAAGATPVGLSAQSFDVMGKIPESAVLLSTESTTSSTQNTASSDRRTQTSLDGAWSFPKVRKPGYYLLTFAKPGYQTQRYIINSAAAIATQPLAVTLVPGSGRLSGAVSGAGGAVGGAQVEITDGTNTLTTSSNSTGQAIGHWAVDGLSTPSTYLVTVSKSGLGAESALVTLNAGGSRVVNLALHAGTTSLVGRVQGVDTLGVLSGIGGAMVTATGGSTTRTATTVTAGPIGRYVLADLPSPGSYVVTITAPGFQPQTQRVRVLAGQSRVTVNATLTSSTAAVAGRVTGDRLNSQGNVVRDSNGAPITEGKSGAGLILSSPQNTYKITTTNTGAFRFNGVAPGSYVLTAQFADFTPGYATVTTIAGRTTIVPTFVLHPQTAASNSTITGFVDDGANPSGTLCAADTTHTACEITFTLTTNGGPPLDISTDGGASFSQHPTVRPERSGPTSYTLSARNGLQPGIYALTIGVKVAPGAKITGYLPATVNVRVPLNGIAHAPQVNLFAASTISGTITSLFDATGGGTFTNCVWAIPNDDTGPPPTDCKKPSTSFCETTGKAQRTAALIAADGTYAINPLCNGTYRMVIVVTNPDFVAPLPNPPPVIEVENGTSAQFNGQIFRLGRILFQLTTPDPATGTTHSLANATLAAGSGCGSLNLSGQTTNTSGELLVTGLPAGPRVCQLKATTSTGLQVSATSPSINVTLDGTATVALTLTAPVGAFIGFVFVGAQSGNTPVPFAQVRVSGITGYTNGIPNPPGQVTVPTDFRGCFAITSDGHVPPPPATGPCAGDPFLVFATRALPLAVPLANVDIDVPGYKTISQQNITIDPSITRTFELVPNPVAFSGELTAPSGFSPDFSAAQFRVTQFPDGTGTFTVHADAAGHISWNDSINGNLIVPGTYTISVTLDGFAPWTFQFTCAVQVTCAPAPFQMVPLGALTLTNLPGDALVTLTNTADGSVVGPESPSGGSVSFANLLPTTPYQTTPALPYPQPAYQLQVHAGGFAFNRLTLACSDGATTINITAGGTTSCAVTLVPEGAITGTVTATTGTTPSDPSSPLAGAVVTVTRCTDQSTPDGAATCATAPGAVSFQATTGADGTYRVTGTNTVEGLNDGAWLVSISAAGYSANPSTTAQPFTVVKVISGGATVAVDARMYALLVGTFSVTVKDAATNAVLTDGLTVTLLQNGTTVATDTTPSASGTFDFSNLVQGTYSVQVTASYILPQTDNNVQVSPTQTAHTVFVTRGASHVSGTASGLQGAGTGPSPMAGVTVQIGTGSGTTFVVADGTDGKPMKTTTSTAGTYDFNNVPDSPAAGWTVVMTKTGYLPNTTTGVSVSHLNAGTVVDATLDRVVHNVTVTLTSDNGYDLTGAQANLAPPPPPPNSPPTNPTEAPQTLVKNGKRYSTTFNAIPFGDWQVWISGLPANHFGVVMTTGANGVAVTAANPLAITVSTDPNGADTNVSLHIDEGELDLSVASKPLPLDPKPASKPATVKLTVSAAGKAVYTQNSFPVDGADPVQIWVTPGTYTVAVNSGAANWSIGTSPKPVVGDDSTPTVLNISLNELGQDVTIHVVTGTPAKDVNNASVKLTPPDPNMGSPTQTTDATGETTFQDVPFGTGWSATATSGTGANQKTGSKTFDVKSTTAQTVTVPIS